MSGYINLIKRSLIFMAKALYICFFFVVAILLLKLLYFPDAAVFPWAGPEVKAVTAEADLIRRAEDNREELNHSHFHIIDEYVPTLGHEPHLCMKCHGVYPHIKVEKTLSFLNLHTGFMACEVCHVRKGHGDRDHYLAWADKKTGRISMRASGGYGKYTALIVPVRTSAGRAERVDELVSEKFSKEYSRLKDRLYIFKEEEEAALKKIHQDNLSKKAVTCDDCHNKDGYMDFAGLGFPQYRINQLSSSEVSRMVEHYRTFYIPRMLMPEQDGGHLP
ncbi:MAG: hypothetical protein OEU95_03480 [Nitrospirota bacterium]|nr:hypothetical protein [Nitrospirota bacterium]